MKLSGLANGMGMLLGLPDFTIVYQIETGTTSACC